MHVTPPSFEMRGTCHRPQELRHRDKDITSLYLTLDQAACPREGANCAEKRAE